MGSIVKMLQPLNRPYDTIITNIMPTERERAQYNKEPEIKHTDNPSPTAISNYLLRLRSQCLPCFIIRIVLLLCFIIGLAYIIL